MSVRHSEYPRDDQDNYVEPAWAVSVLLDYLECLPIPVRVLHDPCCGVGTIVTTATKRGISATGADIVDRACGMFPVKDFLADTTIYENIATNPPFRHAVKIIEHGLAHVADGGRVATLVPVNFLASQGRYSLFSRPETDAVLVLSRRPSMPPGELLAVMGESARHSGSMDFCWCLFRRGRAAGPATIAWGMSS